MDEGLAKKRPRGTGKGSLYLISSTEGLTPEVAIKDTLGGET